MKPDSLKTSYMLSYRQRSKTNDAVVVVLTAWILLAFLVHFIPKARCTLLALSYATAAISGLIALTVFGMVYWLTQHEAKGASNPLALLPVATLIAVVHGTVLAGSFTYFFAWLFC